MNSRKTYSAEEKFLILKEAEEGGVVSTCKKHGIDPTTYYAWKSRYEEEGIEGLIPKKRGRKVDTAKIRKIEKENALLKKLLAEKNLEVEMQAEIIKKKFYLTKKKRK